MPRPLMLGLSQCLVRRGSARWFAGLGNSWEAERVVSIKATRSPCTRCHCDSLGDLFIPMRLVGLSSPEPLAVKTPSPHHWTTRDLLVIRVFKSLFILCDSLSIVSLKGTVCRKLEKLWFTFLSCFPVLTHDSVSSFTYPLTSVLPSCFAHRP